MINIFIGYDPREAVAYHVCANSVIRHASVPVSFIASWRSCAAAMYSARSCSVSEPR